MTKPPGILRPLGIAFTIALAAASTADAQIRVATWNISFYGGGRAVDIQTAIYGTFGGLTMAPDLLIGEEFLSEAAVTEFVTILNTAVGSPGDWHGAPFINGPDTDSAFFYRTTRVDFLGVTVVATGGVSPNHPRNIQRYDVRLKGYADSAAVLACYGTHMKSGSASDDQARRLLEAQRVRDNAEVLTAGWHFLIGGDFNIQSSAQAAYVELVGSQTNNAGRFFDPIATPGSWNNNSTFHFVHTQDPSGAGGMDDRHDQLLVSANLVDGDGFDYIGDPLISYSTTTWNDSNHSYRAWGNDGTSYNVALTVAGNQMVGSAIAQAIINAANGAGHLPVFLDFRVPPKVVAPPTLDFGLVPQGQIAEQLFELGNGGDVALWTVAGIAPLNYSLSASAGFTAPGGAFSDAPGGSADLHVIMMDTSLPGPMSGTLTVTSNAPESPAFLVALTGEVVGPACTPGDADCDSRVNLTDVGPFIDLLLGLSSRCSTCAGDVDGNGALDAADIPAFLSALLP